SLCWCFFFQAEDGIRDATVTGVQTCALPICSSLAVSLHAPDDELRSELVPINRKHPIAELLEACWHYIDEQNGRSVTFEYVMLEIGRASCREREESGECGGA